MKKYDWPLILFLGFVGAALGFCVTVFTITSRPMSCEKALSQAEYYLPCLRNPNCAMSPHEAYLYSETHDRLQECKSE